MRAAVHNCAIEQKYCYRDSDDCAHYTPCHSTGDAHRRKIDGFVLVIARGPDRLIISAGILESDGLESASVEAIRRQFEVNTLGALRCAYQLHTQVKPGGIIAFITSRMGSISDNTSGGYYGYRISKAALNAGAKSLAIDLKSKEIKVAILHPGFVKTDMTNGQGFIDPGTSAAMLKDQIDSWKIEETGHFRHASGEKLPW